MTRHKKFLKSEKTKTKLKCAKLPKGLNVTKTEFKVRKIVIRDQLKEQATLVDGTVVRSSIKVIQQKPNTRTRKKCTKFVSFAGFVDQIAASQCSQSQRWFAALERNHYKSLPRNEQAPGCNIARHLSFGIGHREGCAPRMLQGVEFGICIANAGVDCAVRECDHVVFAMCHDTHQHPNPRGLAVTARLFAAVHAHIGGSEQRHHFHQFPRHGVENAHRIESAAHADRKFGSTANECEMAQQSTRPSAGHFKGHR